MNTVILVIFVGCAFYVQLRGSVRHTRFRRMLTDHSNFMAPINCLFYAFSAVENKPFLDTKKFQELKVFEDNWEKIRAEALALSQQQGITDSKDLDDLGFNSFFKTGWKRFYLKWYGVDIKSAREKCPFVSELLSRVDNVKGAMFAMLPPGARLVRHRDPFAGSLRYHLGLVTPNDDNCYLNVDGETYSWRDGESVMFDETFIHFAENKTDKERIVLFLDVKRPVNFFLIDYFNSLFSRVVMSATVTKNQPGDKVGFLNKVFSKVYLIRILGKKIKARSKLLYYSLQALIYLLLIYLLFF